MQLKPQVRIAGVYLIIATLWILFSDSVLFFFRIDSSLIPSISIIKGMAYVLVTGAILFLHLRREFRQRDKLEEELRARIEEVQRARLVLEQSETRFRKAIEEAPVPMLIFADNGEVLALSRPWYEISGYEPAELKRLEHWAELAYGPQKTAMLDRIYQLFDLTGRVDEGEVIIRCRDGSERTWLFSSTPLGKLPDRRRIVLSIATDVTELRQAQTAALEHEGLKARFQKEQERNALVQRIIAALSHDLRGPLSVIATARDSLAYYGQRMDEEKRAEKLDVIGRQVAFALALVDDTVDMARGRLSEADYRPARINIEALCRVSASEVSSAKQDSHPISFSNPGRLEFAVLDEVLVTRILLNLLSNAIKYSPEGSEVRLEIDRRDGWLLLRVIDQGQGISETDLPHIFEPFYRAEDVRSIRGSGLGLSIVKDCVERHQGRVSVESQPGRGSSFTVELPEPGSHDVADQVS